MPLGMIIKRWGIIIILMGGEMVGMDWREVVLGLGERCVVHFSEEGIVMLIRWILPVAILVACVQVGVVAGVLVVEEAAVAVGGVVEGVVEWSSDAHQFPCWSICVFLEYVLGLEF
jgi:hypothetical protein